MPPPDTKKAGPRANGEPATSLAPTSTITTSIVSHRGIAVTAIAYAPAGRRTCWLSIVERCPHCRGSHVHRGDMEHPASGLRTAGCGSGSYRIVDQVRAGVSP